jgi:GTP-binding protein
VYAGKEFTPGQRGSDYRLSEDENRSTAAERLAARQARRKPYEQLAAEGRAPDGSPLDPALGKVLDGDEG